MRETRIVDWDGEAVSTDRVKVIAKGVRDGIESVLLDPLLICLLLTKFRRAPEGLHDIDRFVGADALQALGLQRKVDAVQHAAFPTSMTDKVEVEYIGGVKTNVLREYDDKRSRTRGAPERFERPPLRNLRYFTV